MLPEYALLFISAVVSATVLPFYSEALLYVVLQEAPSPALAVLIATTGNVLGACVNWWLGREILRFRDRRWFTFSPAQMARAEQGFARYGLWTLLFSWVPVLGDPLTLIAGVLRVRFGVFVLLVTLGKASRYGLIAWFVL